MKPWETLLVKWWTWATAGKRGLVSIPLMLLFVILPAASGFLKSYSELYAAVIPLFRPQTTEISPDEMGMLKQEEWGLIVASANSDKEARDRRDEFKRIYLLANHKNSAGQAIWENDLLIVRDPRQRERWIVVIDMYPGPSSRKQLQDGVLEMIEAEKRSGVRGEPLARWLNGSAPYRFTRREFEKRYGRFTNL
jgi:hypothetical protein